MGGAIPYVDIWDRKPIGLFLIAAAARGLPGDPVVAYHLLALAAAAATAGLIATMARRHAGAAGALAAGLLYLVWLELLGGRGGQSPVFYDLAIVAAALLTRDTIAGRRRAAIPAMLLAGLALQIKPTAVFEGCFFGIALLGATWQRHRNPARLAAAAALYAASALLPTIAAAAAYAGMGHGGAWWFATIESIFLRQATPGDPIAARLAGVAVVLLVPAGLAIRGLIVRPDRFLTGWLAVAVVGWLLVPPYFNHYALPLLVPIAVCAAAALDRRAMQALAAVAGAHCCCSAAIRIAAIPPTCASASPRSPGSSIGCAGRAVCSSSRHRRCSTTRPIAACRRAIHFRSTSSRRARPARSASTRRRRSPASSPPARR